MFNDKIWSFVKKSRNLLVHNSKKFQNNKSLSFSKTLNLTFQPQKSKVDILTWSCKKIKNFKKSLNLSHNLISDFVSSWALELNKYTNLGIRIELKMENEKYHENTMHISKSSKDHETGHNEGQGQIQFWKYDHGVSQAKSELKVRLNV